MSNFTLRILSVVSLLLGIILTVSYGLVFLIKPNWRWVTDLFFTDLKAVIGLLLAAIPFAVAFIARYLSRN